MRFRVATKEAQSRPWIDVGDTTDLTHASAVASELGAFEVGIFVVNPDDTESLYWSTAVPHVYNTDVIELVEFRRKARLNLTRG